MMGSEMTKGEGLAQPPQDEIGDTGITEESGGVDMAPVEVSIGIDGVILEIPRVFSRKFSILPCS